MVAAYFDESANPKLGSIFTIAGYFGLTQDFLYLGYLWEALLKKYGIEYFHAVDCENGTGPFAKFRKGPFSKPLSPPEKEQLRQIKTDFVSAIGQVFLWGVGVNVVLADFRDALKNPHAANLFGKEPYFIAAQLMLSEVGMTVKTFNDAQLPGNQRHDVGFIFDDQKEFRGKALESFEAFQEKNPESATWMASLSYADDKKVIGLQAADNLAYEVMKMALNAIHEPERRERIAMTRLKQTTAKIYRLDRVGLQAIMEQNIHAAPLPTTTLDIGASIY